MRSRKLTGVVLLLVLACARAEAVVVAFDIPPDETIMTSATVEGFFFTSQHFHLVADGYFASNGTTYLSYEGGRGAPITMTMIGGGTFSLLEFDGGEAITSDPISRPTAEAIGVEGRRADGSIVDIHLTLDGITDGGASGSANDFQHFTLPPTFSGLTSVRFYGVRADGRIGGIAMDNLNVDTGGIIPGCGANSVGRTPLSDLGGSSYQGYGGGLYPDGTNTRPVGHESAGLLVADEILPRDSQGLVDPVYGHIGFISIGMSNTNQEFEVFEFASAADVSRHPMVTTVNGAQAGQNATQWANPNNSAWSALATAIANKGLSAPQIQVAWIKLANSGQDVGGWDSFAPFPATATLLQSNLRAVVRNLKARYPNIRIAYLSSRIYGGHGNGEFPEPVAYEEGFGVKWLIEEQINGSLELAYTGSNPAAPYLAWGPYLWADGIGSDGIIGGIRGRSDGLEYSCMDFIDGTTPSPSGRQKVADQLLDFFQTDTISQVWYRDPTPPPASGTPYFVDFDGVDDYLDIGDADSLSFGNGSSDTPLTFEAWVRPDSVTARQNLINKWQDGLNVEYKLYFSSGVARLDLRDVNTAGMVSVYAFVTQSMPVGTWHHLAVTYDGRGGANAAGGVNFYVDGVAVPVTRVNSAAYVAMSNRTTPLQIGRETTNYKQYNGALDELRIWNVVRTPSQIQSNMASELTGSEAGLVAYWRFNEGTGTTVADDSPLNHVASMRNGTQWGLGGPMEPPALDETPPIISNIVVSALTDSSVTITFDTNEITRGWISYTQNASCPCADTYDPASGTRHAITLSGLAPDTIYTFEVKATDLAGNFQVGPTAVFRTLIPTDTTPPSVFMTSPAAGTAAGSIIVEAIASDGIGVVGVQFKLDGNPLGIEDLTYPYSTTWDTTTVVNGVHTLSAEARDAAGNVATSSVVVTVSNFSGSGTPYFVDFDGVDDYLDIGDADSLSFGNGSSDTPLTFEAWVRPDSVTARQNLINKWQDGLNVEYKLYFSSGVARLDLRDVNTAGMVSVYAFVTQSMPVGTWHHLAVTYDGRGGANAAGGVNFYVDGVAVPVTRVNSAAYVAMSNRTTPLQIGRETTNYKQYNGALDELRIWNVVRTPSQIQSNMASELTGSEAGLVAYWRFNEGTGLAAFDAAPFGHVATLRNNTAWAAGGPFGP